MVALNNAIRIAEIQARGENVDDILWLEEGMRALGFDPTLDPTNHVNREFELPSGRERDW